jgi:hypothetical protein
MARAFQPCKDLIGEREVADVGFQLVNENAGVERDFAVMPEEVDDAI